jgi:hypothetical protein
VDILVHKDDVLRTKDLLYSCGYQPFYPLPSGEEIIFRRWECPFTNGKLFVDLHWGIIQPYFARVSDPESLWRNLEHLSLEGHPISTFSRSDLLLHLCMHGAKHHWERLDWICDLAELIRSGREVKWHWIMEQADAIGSKRMTYLGVFLAHSLLDADVPENIQQDLFSDAKVVWLAEQACKRLFPQAHERNHPVEDITYYLRAMDRSRDRIRHCLDRLINPTPWSVGEYSLPSYLFFVNYFLRPLQLVKKYCSRPRYHESQTK